MAFVVRTQSTIATAAMLIALCLPVHAQSGEGWSIFRGEGGLVTEFPAGIFNIDAGPTEKGSGRRFKSEDGRYEFAGYSLDNLNRETPSSYLRNNLIVDPSSLIYRRVTDRFFVLSSIRNGRIFYSRCNFYSRIQCIYLEYPKSEKEAWDRIVTRISYSLRTTHATLE